jgi:aminomethyltransferase
VIANLLEIHMSENPLLRTPLYEVHKALGAKLVPFAGYEMPVQYPTGVMAEHNWTREHAGLFDVSHMGQSSLFGPSFEETAAALEKLVPADIRGLQVGQQRYSQLLNVDGGTLDDLMITRQPDGDIDLVLNAGRKDDDFAHIVNHLSSEFELTRWDELSLLALQGPKAVDVLVKFLPEIADLKFMYCFQTHIGEIGVQISRSGYTGEDGFEISVHNDNVETLWNILRSDANVIPIGLGARDSLRLEAGLCLYGHELNDSISPIEAGLQWSIAKRRREEGGFIGASRVQKELADGPTRKRVGIKPEGRAPAREGTEIQNLEGRKIGTITSGGFGPTVNGPVAMGYVEAEFSAADTKLNLIVRGQAMSATIVKLPFVPNNFKR